MLLLIASLLALVAGPLLLAVSGQRRALLAFMDGFVVIALGGLVLLHLLPDSFEMAGAPAVLAALVGVLLPWLFERGLTRGARVLQSSLLWAALAGLIVHAMLDGAALTGDHAPAAGRSGGLLAASVILHRFPVGLALWWLVVPSRGLRGALVVLAINAAATVVGFFGAEPLMHAAPLGPLGAFQALVAGTLIHVIVGHQTPALEELAYDHPRAGAAGALAGGASLAFVSLAHGHHDTLATELSAPDAFVALAARSAPFVLAAWALVAARRLRRPAGGQANEASSSSVRAALCGLTSIAADATFERGGNARGPVGPVAIARHVAALGLGLDTLLVSVILLGARLAAVRASCIAVTAILTSRALSRMDALGGAPLEQPDAPTTPTASVHGIKGALTGILEAFERVGPWLMLGLAIAALIEPVFPGDWLPSVPGWLQIALVVPLGLVGSISALAATPVAAVLLHKGLSAGALLTWLVIAPTASLTVLAGMARRYGRQAALRYAITVALVAVGGALAIDRVPVVGSIDVHAWAGAAPTAPQLVALGVLALMLLHALFRRGPRPLLAHVFETHRHEHESGRGH